MKAFAHEELFKLDGDVPLVRAVPYGVQHILAMFVANLAPIVIVAGVVIAILGERRRAEGAKPTETSQLP